MAIRTQNPATGEIIRRFDALSDGEIDARLQRAIDTFGMYRTLPFPERARMMEGAARVLEERKREYARTMTLEMGKPIAASVQEVEKCARCCRYYAEHAEGLLADDQEQPGPPRTFVTYQPLGPVLAVMPWNFPFWQVFRFAAPALMAGNVGLLKHASNVPQCALGIEEVFARAGFPGGTFQTLLIGSDQVPDIIEDGRISAVTLTGSVGAGRSVAGAAGSAIKKSVLELGGSDPFIVMPSADLERTVAAATRRSSMMPGTLSEPTSSVWKAPPGKPAQRKTSSIASAHWGTLEACLRRPTLPAMRPGAAKRKTCQNGKFHGMIASTTPSGWYFTQVRAASDCAGSSARKRSACCA